METNFLINKVKNKGKFLFTSCLLGTMFILYNVD
jgi:hypothetical protein